MPAFAVILRSFGFLRWAGAIFAAFLFKQVLYAAVKPFTEVILDPVSTASQRAADALGAHKAKRVLCEAAEVSL